MGVFALVLWLLLEHPETHLLYLNTPVRVVGKWLAHFAEHVGVCPKCTLLTAGCSLTFMAGWLQIGVGSGIKCGVNVWQAVRDVRDVQDAWAHRAPDSDVLRDQRRGGSNQLGLLLLLLAVLVVLAAYMFHFAQAARLL